MKQLAIGKAQDYQIAAHFADDKGDQIFMICRQGGERAMKKYLDLRRPFYCYVDMQFIGYVDETTKP